MAQDLRTCPGCGAPPPDRSPCPYCGLTPDLSEEPNLGPIEAVGSQPAAGLSEDSPAQTYEIGDKLIDAAQDEFPGIEIENESRAEGEEQNEDDSRPEAKEAIETDPVRFSELLKTGSEPEHLLEQVPEELRGVLAARLKAAEETDVSGFSKNTASNLRGQGFIISEDARGVRLAADPSRSGDLSASDMVKMAAELEGGVQPRTKLPICSKCQAASPVGEPQCQWCGEPFEQGQ